MTPLGPELTWRQDEGDTRRSCSSGSGKHAQELAVPPDLSRRSVRALPYSGSAQNAGKAEGSRHGAHLDGVVGLCHEKKGNRGQLAITGGGVVTVRTSSDDMVGEVLVLVYVREREDVPGLSLSPFDDRRDGRLDV